MAYSFPGGRKFPPKLLERVWGERVEGRFRARKNKGKKSALKCDLSKIQICQYFKYVGDLNGTKVLSQHCRHWQMWSQVWISTFSSFSLWREKRYINQLAQAIFKTTKLPQICKLKEIVDLVTHTFNLVYITYNRLLLLFEWF